MITPFTSGLDSELMRRLNMLIAEVNRISSVTAGGGGINRTVTPGGVMPSPSSKPGQL